MIPILSKKLPAGALISTLVIALILAITCSTLLMGLYHFRYFQTKNEIAERLDTNIESAMTLALSDSQIYPAPVRDSLLLFEATKDSVFFYKELWGIFPLATITVTYKSRKKERSFLYGASAHTYSDATVYLADHNRPLSVTGDTYIAGKLYLPKSGLRSGFFNEKEFSGKKLIEGQMDSSKTDLPPLDTSFIQYFKILSGMHGDYPILPPSTPAISNAFIKEAEIYRVNSQNDCSNRSLSGKIMVVCDDILELDSSCHLQDVILIAPYIHFKEGFSGTVQAFALDSIIIGNNCRFKYPSSLVATGHPDSSVNTGSTITIHEGSVVNGAVIALSINNSTATRPIINVEKGAVINGLLYNEGHTCLKGKVAGAVYTNFFVEKNNAVSILNNLTEAIIVESNWLSQGSYFTFFKEAHRKQIVKWLK